VKRKLKIILALVLITPFILLGIIVIEPTKTHGQPKGKLGLPQRGERDPFLLPQGVRLFSKSDAALVTKGMVLLPETKTTDIPLPPLTVKAILISDRIRLASIDRTIVTVGDSIGDEKVLEIEPHRVVLGKGDKRRTLVLFQSPIRLTVEER
jgi:hypothetical protein